MSEKEEERNRLARLRTLLALERNYLAEERTQLARLRTGLAFTLIVPSVYLFITSIDINIPLFFLIIFFIFIGFFFIRGVWTVITARSKLKKIRKKKEIVKKREKQIIDSSESIQNTFENCTEFNDN
jgi:uncharacterized membrane protein YidH (DUF202 family)